MTNVKTPQRWNGWHVGTPIGVSLDVGQLKGVNAVCPNPNVAVKLPSTITFRCR